MHVQVADRIHLLQSLMFSVALFSFIFCVIKMREVAETC